MTNKVKNKKVTRKTRMFKFWWVAQIAQWHKKVSTLTMVGVNLGLPIEEEDENEAQPTSSFESR